MTFKGLSLDANFRFAYVVITHYTHAPKGIFRKAIEKASRTVPGVGVPYEEHVKPEITVDSHADANTVRKANLRDTE